MALAYSLRTHPLREWLTSLHWDRQKRVDRWLNRYLGVAQSEYSSLVGRFFLISMVARVMKPGCKVDSMLILEGQQGRGKSSALRILAGDEYFSDALADIRGKDASMALRGRWLVELAELAASSKAEAEHLKAFLTRQSEMYRPPFERLEVDEPRQCVIAGSTNDCQYLRDATGGRRFWPVLVGEIDLPALERDRAQLFAEAMEMLKLSDARWWPTAAEQARLFNPEQADRQESDPWDEPVQVHLNEVIKQAKNEGKAARVTLADIAGCRKLGLEISRATTATNKRLVAILSRLGWIQRRTKNSRYYEPTEEGRNIVSP
nr:virulence-associated E family protein [Acetobacter sp. P5B1]